MDCLIASSAAVDSQESVDWVLSILSQVAEPIEHSDGDSELHGLVSYAYTSDEAVEAAALDEDLAAQRELRSNTPLHYSVRQVYFHGISLLAGMPSQVSHPNDDGISPLHMAVLLQQYAEEVCSILLENGANPLAQDDLSLSPLHYASIVGSAELVCLLLQEALTARKLECKVLVECTLLAIRAENSSAVLGISTFSLGSVFSDGFSEAFSNFPFHEANGSCIAATSLLIRKCSEHATASQRWHDGCLAKAKDHQESVQSLSKQLAEAEASRVKTQQALAAAEEAHVQSSASLRAAAAQASTQREQLDSLSQHNERLADQYRDACSVAAQMDQGRREAVALAKELLLHNTALRAQLLALKTKHSSLEALHREHMASMHSMKAHFQRLDAQIETELVRVDKSCTPNNMAVHTNQGHQYCEDSSPPSDDADSFTSAQDFEEEDTERETANDHEDFNELLTAQSTLAENALPLPWEAGFAESGQFYYYNSDTEESFWEMPAELAELLAADEGNDMQSIPVNRTMDVWATFFERLAASNGFAVDAAGAGGAAAGALVSEPQGDLMNEAMELFLQAVHDDNSAEAFDIWADQGLPSPHLCFDGDSKNKITALHVAAWNNSEEMVAMLANCDSAVDVDCTDAMGNTPLHIAAMHGHTALVQLLVSKSQAVAVPNANGETILRLASQTHDVDHLGAVCSAISSSSAHSSNPEVLADAERCAANLRDALSQAAVLGVGSAQSTDVDSMAVKACVLLLEGIAAARPLPRAQPESPTASTTSSSRLSSAKQSPLTRTKRAHTEPPSSLLATDTPATFSLWSSLRHAFRPETAAADESPPYEQWQLEDEDVATSAPPTDFTSGVGVQSPGLAVFKKKRGSVYKRSDESAFNTPGTLSRRMSQEDSPRLGPSKLTRTSSFASSTAQSEVTSGSTPPPAPSQDAPPPVVFLQPMPMPPQACKPTPSSDSAKAAVTGRYVNTFA